MYLFPFFSLRSSVDEAVLVDQLQGGRNTTSLVRVAVSQYTSTRGASAAPTL